MMTRYFGRPWPSGICDDGIQVETPVGIACRFCEEPICDGEQGTFVTAYGSDQVPRGVPVHRECSLRNVLGGIEHLTALPGHTVGSCYDGSTLSYRESALQAWMWVQEHGYPAA